MTLDIADRGHTVPGPSPRFAGAEEAVEAVRRYIRGGFHPVLLGDVLDNGRYLVINKLGYGGSATVWLCQDRTTKTPKYVAVKIIVASVQAAECGDLIMAARIKRHCAEQQLHNLSRKHISLPIRHFEHIGPNGTHQCLVYPVLGPHVGRYMHLFGPVKSPGDAARGARTLLRGVVSGVSFLHSLGVAHGDLRPQNVLFGLIPLDGRSIQDLEEMLGTPDTDAVIIGQGAKRDNPPGVPPYLVYPVEFDVSSIVEEAYITDFGESFDAADSGARKTGIPKLYSPPEQVFNHATGIAGDLWSLALLLFEVRLGQSLIEGGLCTLSDLSYKRQVSLFLGRFPDNWWKSWPERHACYDMADQVAKPHDALRVATRMGRGKRAGIYNGPRSIAEKIREACSVEPGYDGEGWIQPKVSDKEQEIFSALLAGLLRYNLIERISAAQVLQNTWFEL